jgi:hypothetical protein
MQKERNLHTYMLTNAYIYIYIYIYIYKHTHTHTHTHRSLCKYMRTECLEHHYVYESPMPVQRLVLLVADKEQVTHTSVHAYGFIFVFVHVHVCLCADVLLHAKDHALVRACMHMFNFICTIHMHGYIRSMCLHLERFMQQCLYLYNFVNAAFVWLLECTSCISVRRLVTICLTPNAVGDMHSIHTILSLSDVCVFVCSNLYIHTPHTKVKQLCTSRTNDESTYICIWISCICTRLLTHVNTLMYQVCTQSASSRPFGVGLLVAGYDQTGPHIFYNCPSGVYEALQRVHIFIFLRTHTHSLLM